LRLAAALCKRNIAYCLWFANFGERVAFGFSEFVQVQFHGMATAKKYTRAVLAAIATKNLPGIFKTLDQLDRVSNAPVPERPALTF